MIFVVTNLYNILVSMTVIEARDDVKRMQHYYDQN